MPQLLDILISKSKNLASHQFGEYRHEIRILRVGTNKLIKPQAWHGSCSRCGLAIEYLEYHYDNKIIGYELMQKTNGILYFLQSNGKHFWPPSVDSVDSWRRGRRTDILSCHEVLMRKVLR